MCISVGIYMCVCMYMSVSVYIFVYKLSPQSTRGLWPLQSSNGVVAIVKAIATVYIIFLHSHQPSERGNIFSDTAFPRCIKERAQKNS